MENFYNPDFFDIFVIDILFQKEYRDICAFLNQDDRKVLREFNKAMYDENQHRNVLNNYPIVKENYEKWFRQTDHTIIKNKIKSKKDSNEKTKNLKVQPF